MTPSVATENSYLASRAWLLKGRWEKRLGRELDVQTDRLMPGKHGQSYHADIVLQDPVSRLPLVVFEVKSPAKTIEQTADNLRRILDTRRFIQLLGGQRPTAVLLVPATDEAAARNLLDRLGAEDTEVEVI